MRTLFIIASLMFLIVEQTAARSLKVLITPPVKVSDTGSMGCVVQNIDSRKDYSVQKAALVDSDGHEIVSTGGAQIIPRNTFKEILFTAATPSYAYCKFTVSNKKKIRGYITTVTEPETTKLIVEAH